MNNKGLSKVLYFLLALFLLVGLFMCFGYFPSVMGLYNGSSNALSISEFVVQIVLSIPCFYILFIGFTVAKELASASSLETNFIKIKRMGFILLIDSILFCLANIIFIIIKCANVKSGFPFISSHETLLLLIAIIGVGISITMIEVSKTVKEGKEYKDDSEAII